MPRFPNPGHLLVQPNNSITAIHLHMSTAPAPPLQHDGDALSLISGCPAIGTLMRPLQVKHPISSVILHLHVRGYRNYHILAIL